MKMNRNKSLLAVLVALVAAFVFTKVFRTPALKSNLDAKAFAVDTARVRSISVQRPGDPEIIIEKAAGTWTVKEENKQAKAERYAIDNIMRIFASATPERIVSRNKGKWNTYQVDDSTSIHVTAFDGDKTSIADWHVGKQAQGSTYVRRTGDETVYALEGTIRSTLENDFDDWRDKTFLKFDPASITAVKFQYPADSGFVLQKNNAAWMIGNQPADSAKVERYLQRFRSRSLSAFADTPPAAEPEITLSLETNQGTGVIKAWKEDDDRWILHSTTQEGTYFIDGRIDDDLFVGKVAFEASDSK